MSVERTTAAGGMETSYGFKRVGAGDKQSLVNDVFHKVANRYDLMNDLMSAGLHRLWKDAMVTWLHPPKRMGWRVLDVAGGTGDIAFRIVDASHGNAHATVLDINGSMLAVGRDRAEKKGLSGNTDFVEANAEELPFEDESFDAAVLKDLLEHVADPTAVVREVRRVVRPGGRVFASSPDAQRWVWDDYTHRRPFTRKAFRLLFADQGFAIEQLGYESVMPGTGIISAKMPNNRRPLPLRVAANLPLVRRNVWVLARR